SDPSLFVRGLVIGELMNIDPDRDPGPILRAISDGDSSVGEPSPEDVIRAQLHRLNALDSVPILIRGLASEEHETRARSAGVLGELADRRAEPALAATSACDDRRAVRNAAREALEQIMAVSAAG
ncbi:MAG: HEAT repeat domain-containing protein, partial [Actinomycetota bacterium]|nr:HEAT repeat domain-containing protein [Actinomycetota bacterium]